MQRAMQKSEVVLCENCEGKGFKWHSELVNYHKGEYDTTKQDCSVCAGSGRLCQETVVTFKPYQ